MNAFFITATDTDAGKTLVATALIEKLVSQGFSVAAFKPISAGCELIDGQLINGDAQSLYHAANCQQTIQEINPIAFEEPIAPHIAALKANVTITIDKVNDDYQKVVDLNSDIVITEGAGGWRLPLGGGNYLSDFAKAQQIPVILVVHMKLGCLNHALLTYQAIIADGLSVAGWVANAPQEMPYLAENIAELKEQIRALFLGQIGFVKNTVEAQNCLTFEALSLPMPGVI